MSEGENQSLLDTERKQIGKIFNSRWKRVLTWLFF